MGASIFSVLFYCRATNRPGFHKTEKKEKAIKTLVDTYKRLKKQKLSVMVAPEGSRKHDGIIGPFKKGAFRMAMDLEYPILPIYFEGNNQLGLGGSIFSKSGNIIAHLHPFVPTDDWSLETIDESYTGCSKFISKLGWCK